MNDPRTWVALPRQFWPKEWVDKGMIRQMVPLIYSLYGHPRAGNRWDLKMDTDVKKCNFKRAPLWKGVYKQNDTGAGLGVYVDDFEPVATPEDTPKIWKLLEMHIEFKEDYRVWDSKPTAHLGCDYTVKKVENKL